jgi:hypothetical protein
VDARYGINILVTFSIGLVVYCHASDAGRFPGVLDAVEAEGDHGKPLNSL